MTSTSRVTPKRGTPRAAGGIPQRKNLPKRLMSCALALTSLDQMRGWLSAETVNVCAIWWRRLIAPSRLGQTPPAVFRPTGRRVATNSRKTCTEHLRCGPRQEPHQAHCVLRCRRHRGTSPQRPWKEEIRVQLFTPGFRRRKGRAQCRWPAVSGVTINSSKSCTWDVPRW